jgi:hypothetical protein
MVAERVDVEGEGLDVRGGESAIHETGSLPDAGTK